MPQQETKVVFNLATLRRQLEIKEGRTIPWRELADEADLSKDTVNRMATNSATRVDTLTLKKLLVYFRTHGMQIGVGDLFREIDINAPLPR